MKVYDMRLDESLPLSVARKFRKQWRGDPEGLGLLSRLVETGVARPGTSKWRVEIPLQIDKDEMDSSSSFRDDVEEALWMLGGRIVNYRRGIMVTRDGQKIKIGKYLNKAIKAFEKVGVEEWIVSKLKDAKRKFDTDPARESKQFNDLLIVLSVHPYDIAGASTNRNWTSCYNLEEPTGAMNVATAITSGAMVAYLVDSNDRNINEPISRILIVPFMDLETGDVIFRACEKIYGARIPAFGEKLKDALETIFDKWRIAVSDTAMAPEDLGYVQVRDIEPEDPPLSFDPFKLNHVRLGEILESMYNKYGTSLFEKFDKNVVRDLFNDDRLVGMTSNALIGMVIGYDVHPTDFRTMTSDFMSPKVASRMLASGAVGLDYFDKDILTGVEDVSLAESMFKNPIKFTEIARLLSSRVEDGSTVITDAEEASTIADLLNWVMNFYSEKDRKYMVNDLLGKYIRYLSENYGVDISNLKNIADVFGREISEAAGMPENINGKLSMLDRYRIPSDLNTAIKRWMIAREASMDESLMSNGSIRRAIRKMARSIGTGTSDILQQAKFLPSDADLEHYLSFADRLYRTSREKVMLDWLSMNIDDFTRKLEELENICRYGRRTFTEDEFEDAHPDATKLIDFGDGYAWFLIPSSTSPLLADTMGHCGNQPRILTGDRILSLHRINGDVHTPVLTFVVNNKGWLGEMKGRANSKPSPKYHNYIVPLLEHPIVKGIGYGVYDPSNDFSVDDLDQDTKERLLAKKPLLGARTSEDRNIRIEMFNEQVKNLMNRLAEIYTDSVPREDGTMKLVLDYDNDSSRYWYNSSRREPLDDLIERIRSEFFGAARGNLEDMTPDDVVSGWNRWLTANDIPLRATSTKFAPYFKVFELNHGDLSTILSMMVNRAGKNPMVLVDTLTSYNITEHFIPALSEYVAEKIVKAPSSDA